MRIGRGTGEPQAVQAGLAAADPRTSSGISNPQAGQCATASRSRAIALRHSVSTTRRSGSQSPSVKERVNRSRRPAGIAFQRGVFYGGNSDAAAVHLVRNGVPTGIVNIARRYAHSPVEVIDLPGDVRFVGCLERRVGADGEIDVAGPEPEPAAVAQVGPLRDLR